MTERHNPHLQRRNFRMRFKDNRWVLIEYDREEDRTYTQEVNARKAEELLDDSFRDGYLQLDDLKTIEDVRSALAGEFEWGPVFTAEAWKERRIEEARQEFEAFAADIARRHKVKVNSPEFLDACESELARFRDYREGMREDGLCMGYGVTPEQWFEERNASHGDSERVHKLMEWIEENLPLLHARWKEGKEVAEKSA